MSNANIFLILYVWGLFFSIAGIKKIDVIPERIRNYFAMYGIWHLIAFVLLLLLSDVFRG